ncbi:MAG: RiPP maturation radical SAM C-methyltransferase [Maledivibacter sp.]|jgi:ribosomal peptide maturation radical SAM protein 1|nr:RiPP maturation radical SAM C-methyltransferase [Maledivibacter sp.]
MDTFFGEKILKQADVLLILPPFACVEGPSIGLHILQACADEHGFSVQVAYANMAFAYLLGYENYKNMCASYDMMIGEVFFANAAYGTSPFAKSGFDIDSCFDMLSKNSNKEMDMDTIKKIYYGLDEFLDKMAEEILEYNYRIIGCSTTFNQTAASIALLNRIKLKNPEIITIIGGANCEREMAEGILSLSNKIDYIFSGKSEISFPNFLKNVFNSNTPRNKIIESEKSIDVEDIPLMDYTNFYEQFHHFSMDTKIPKDDILLFYETSRGCWWGQKHQCNFCGLNGDDIGFKEKSCDKIIKELKTLLAKHPSNNIAMVDNIMPYNFTDTLLPALHKEIPDIRLFYEVKANMPLEHLIKLKDAGAYQLQPGIEGLSSSLLKRMSKGTSTKLNIMFLKNALSLNMATSWNLLYGFPGDIYAEYEETLKLLPLIVHLEPPIVFTNISLQRFSKYFEQNDKFGITNLTPISCYKNFLPKNADANKLAYDFNGDYEYFSHDNEPVIIQIKSIIKKWQKKWAGNTIPKLHISKASQNNYLLMDTRGLSGTKSVQILSYKQALAALKDRPLGQVENLEEEIEWAIKQNLIVELDGWYVSLITAEPELLLEFKNIS